MTQLTRTTPILAGTLTSILTFGPVPITLIAVGHAAGPEEGHYQSIARPGTSIDWTRGVIVAKGSAAPIRADAMISDPASLTRQAARMAAFRALLDGLNMTCLDATTTVGKYLAAHQDIRVTVEALAQGAPTVAELQRDDGVVETTIELDLAELFAVLMQPRTQATLYTQTAQK